MNTIQPLDSKTQIYNKHTITLINAYIAKRQKQQERDSKSVWLQNNHSKINKQASEQIKKGAGEQGSRKECMELKRDSFHSPCAALLTRSTGACAQGLQLWGTTGCHSRWCRNDIRQTHEAAQREERTRIRALLDTALEHKPLLWGKQMKTLVPNGCKWNPSYLLSQHFPPGPDWASFFIIPLSLRLFFLSTAFSPHPSWPKCGQQTLPVSSNVRI